MDASMTKQALEEFDTSDLDLLFMENVGNLVCPAEQDTGATVNAVILSLPEGDDKPLKYPLMFQVCHVVVVNKIDVMPYFDFDMEKCRENVHIRIVLLFYVLFSKMRKLFPEIAVQYVKHISALKFLFKRIWIIIFLNKTNHLDSTSASQTDAMTTNQHRKTTRQ
jgi:hydrogenase accessory protein HypB